LKLLGLDGKKKLMDQHYYRLSGDD
jgi:hypothetical protein